MARALRFAEDFVEFAGAAVTLNMLTAAIASWVILTGLWLFVTRTHTGRAMQAVSMDLKGAAISGIDPNRTNLITWGISGALGAVAGVFFASYTQLYPGMWVAPLLISVAVVIVGGIGSIWGTLIVAHIIGFMEVITTSLVAAELRGVFTMLLIIGVLVIRPRGLFGRAELRAGWANRPPYASECPLDLFTLEDLDDVVGADVVVVLEGHAAFLTGVDLLDLVLEPLEGLQLALVDHHVVAEQAHPGGAPGDAFGDLAAGDLANPGDLEHFLDPGVADKVLLDLRAEQARGGLFHVIDQVVDDRVVADLDPLLVRALARRGISADVEADDRGAGGIRQGHVRFGDGADPRVQHADADLLVADLLQRLTMASTEPCTSALTTIGSSLTAPPASAWARSWSRVVRVPRAACCSRALRWR